jgi:hypothetical protein
VDFVLGQGGRVGERLMDVFFLEVREFRDDLRRRHPVCDEIDDMRDGDPEAADRCPPGEDGRILRDAIERAFHDVARAPLYRTRWAPPSTEASQVGLYRRGHVDRDEAIGERTSRSIHAEGS